MKITPLKNQVLLKKYNTERKNKPVFTINAPNENLDLASIILIGHDANQRLNLFVGNIVGYIPCAVKTIKDGDEEYLLIEDKYIIALIEDL